MTELQTKRLMLRAFNENDYIDVLEIYQQPSVCRYLLHDAWEDNIEAKKMFAKKVKNHTLTEKTALSVAVLLEDKVIGDIDVWYTGMKATVEVGFTFHPDFQGKGYASESLAALFEQLFIQHKVHRIQAMLDARNQASKGLCQKMKMREEAHFIQDYWNKDEWTDTYVFGLLASEFNQTTK